MTRPLRQTTNACRRAKPIRTTAKPGGGPAPCRPRHQNRDRRTDPALISFARTRSRSRNPIRPSSMPARPRRCGRPLSRARPPSARAATRRARPRIRPRCSRPSPRTPSPTTPGPASWCSTRCAGSAPPSSKPSTPAGAAIGVEYEPQWAADRPRQPRPRHSRTASATAAGRHRRRPPAGPSSPPSCTARSPSWSPQPALRAVHPRPGLRDPASGCTSTTTATGASSTAETWPTSATTGCWPGSPASSPPRPFLRPGGRVVITVRPWREHAELVDLPAQIAACGRARRAHPRRARASRCSAGSPTTAVHRPRLLLPTRLHRQTTRRRPTAAPDRPRRRDRPAPAQELLEFEELKQAQREPECPPGTVSGSDAWVEKEPEGLAS